jgi:hypothetical protein
MYAFGMIALLGLAVLAVARVANRYLSLASEVWAFVLVAPGVGAAGSRTNGPASGWPTPLTWRRLSVAGWEGEIGRR